MASIYNIQTWQNSTGSQGPFKKNDIIRVGDGTYWYATKDHNETSSPTLSTPAWGGNISITIGGSAAVNPYFFWAPSYSFNASHQPSVNVLAFGDGYTQRLKGGINNDLLKVSLHFDARNERETTAIVHFLQEKGSYKPFFFKTPAPYSLIKKFVCPTWSTAMSYDDNYTIQASFEEVS